MNIFEIIVIAIIAIYALVGYHTGFLRVIYSLFAWTLAFALGSFASPHLAAFLEQNTGIKGAIQKACEGYLSKLAGSKITDPTIAVFGGVLEDTGIYEGIAAKAAGYLLKGVSFLAVMLVIGILMSLLWHILDVASHLPVIEGANKMLGAAAGALKGFMIVWGIFSVVRLCSGTQIGEMALGWIEESVLLKNLYEYNFLIWIIMKVLGME
ncbi:MAG: CvpA family protein [Eubacterium sp.]|jgi:uncharacterized membrane protein required for colicin V production|nr:CvpA family protein [Eubacterium sp.]NBI88269.1 CvpA family protein [Lachnospiraceae bacterium]